MQYFIGIDSSTTATKAILIDEQGDVVAVGATEYGYETPKPLWSEQDPELWWNGAAASIRQVLADSGIRPDDVHGIGLTGQMHGLVLLNEDGKVLRVIPLRRMAVVEGLNLVKRHVRKTQENPQGGIVEKEAPFPVAKLRRQEETQGKKTKKTAAK